MKVLITGGNGFIGQCLMAKFEKESIDYISVDTKHTESEHLKCRNILTAPGTAFLRRCINESDAVIHLIGEGDIQTCQQFPEVSFSYNIKTLQIVLDACRLAGGKKLIFPSTAAVYGIPDDVPIKETAPLRPNNTYAHHKAICEHMIQAYQEAYKLEYVILRLFNVYGRGVKGLFIRFLDAIKEDKEFTAFGVSQYRDFVYIGDVADALFKAAVEDKAVNKIVNIGSGYGMQIREVLECMKYFYPEAKLREVKSNLPLYDHISDITKARLILGYTPHTGPKFMMEVLKKEICQV